MTMGEIIIAFLLVLLLLGVMVADRRLERIEAAVCGKCFTDPKASDDEQVTASPR